MDCGHIMVTFVFFFGSDLDQPVSKSFRKELIVLSGTITLIFEQVKGENTEGGLFLVPVMGT